MQGKGYYGIELKKGEIDRDLLQVFGKFCKDETLAFGVSEIARFRDRKFGMFWWHGSRIEALRTFHRISRETNRMVLMGKKNVYHDNNNVSLYDEGKMIEECDPNEVVTIYTAI